MNNFGLPDRTINELLEYFSNNTDIEKVLIFGSRARATYRTGSDIDLAIFTDNHQKFYKIANELDELPTPYKFDVIDYKTLTHEGMKESIDKDGQVFYKKK